VLIVCVESLVLILIRALPLLLLNIWTLEILQIIEMLGKGLITTIL